MSKALGRRDRSLLILGLGMEPRRISDVVLLWLACDNNSSSHVRSRLVVVDKSS